MRAREIVEAVASITGRAERGPIKLHEPDIGWREHAYVAKCLDGRSLAHGHYIRLFEKKLCEITGAKFAVATCSGTAALHLAGRMFRDAWFSQAYIGVPSLTFVATANAVRYCGYTPYFAGVGEQSQISSAILGATQHYSAQIEDAAPALGSIGAGRQGQVGVFSFNGNKICTSGGGGAVVTDDQSLAEQIRHLANVAKSSATEHDQIGFNYRMPNYNAALGLAQLERLPEFLERKALLANRYERAFGELFWKPPAGSNNWLNAILVDNRDEVVTALNEAGLESRALHAPLHTLPMYKDCPRGDMTRTMEIWNRCVCLPSGAGLA